MPKRNPIVRPMTKTVFSKPRLGKRGMFGLTSVQSFFAIIMSLALLAYVIVVITGVLTSSSVIAPSTEIARVANESSWLNGTGDTLNTVGIDGWSSLSVITVINATDNLPITAGNYTISANGAILNKTAVLWNRVNITYNYNYHSDNYNRGQSILGNTSVGVTSFFTSINPVYAILAILVIILVLVVLVRVVAGNNGTFSTAEPSI